MLLDKLRVRVYMKEIQGAGAPSHSQPSCVVDSHRARSNDSLPIRLGPANGYRDLVSPFDRLALISTHSFESVCGTMLVSSFRELEISQR